MSNIYLSSKPWRSHHIGDVSIPVTMLNTEELTLLHWFSSAYFSGQGEIIDAGCFLGGSTAALASGLATNTTVYDKKGRINSFDLFILEAYAKRDYFPDPSYEVGDSTFSLFRENISAWASFVHTFQGDICQFPWNQKPIELLFIDVAKTAKINEYLVRNYFHHLIPGISVLIQQDYVHEWLPWIHVAMELFIEYFDILDYFGGGSVVFSLKREIPASLLSDFSLGRLSVSRQVALMDQAVERAPAIYQGVLKLPKVRLLHDLGFKEEAQALLTRVSQEHGHEARIAQALAPMAQYLLA